MAWRSGTRASFRLPERLRRVGAYGAGAVTARWSVERADVLIVECEA